MIPIPGVGNYFEYNGRRSDEMGLMITKMPAATAAERDLEFISVPGRDGDIIIDNGRYKNVTVEYETALLSPRHMFAGAVRNIASWLNGSRGYCVLRDTYDYDYFRYARYCGALSVENILMQIGNMVLPFSCKPYRYLVSGQTPITASPDRMPLTLTNPESVESKPYIKITGSGDVRLTVNSHAFDVHDIDGYIELDGELAAAHKGGELQNNKIAFTSFPTFGVGDSEVAVFGSVTAVEIIPRWRTL